MTVEKRDQLITKGKTEGLSVDEANELKSILCKEATEDYACGKLSPFALVVINSLINLIANAFVVQGSNDTTNA